MMDGISQIRENDWLLYWNNNYHSSTEQDSQEYNCCQCKYYLSMDRTLGKLIKW